MGQPKHDSPRWKVWPVVFLLCVLALIWFMATHTQNIGQAVLVLLTVLVLAGIAQRVAFYMRRGRPNLSD
jgi:energy-coupling factor transporter transmembrane protein EcfT